MNPGLQTALPPTAEETSRAICQLHPEICRLKQHLDTVCLMERLPTELLEEIFLCYLWAPIDLQLNAGCFMDLKQSDVDRLLHTLASVCSSWRSTVMHCPSLWSIVCNGWGTYCDRSYTWPGPRLPKSGTGPLYISGDMQETYRTPGILEHASRIKELYWELSADDGWFDARLIQRALAGPSPRLTVVVLAMIPGIEDLVILPADLFAAAQSVLRLDIATCWFDKDEVRFPPRLRMLSLQSPVTSGVLPALWSVLIMLVDQCPELEQLYIDGDAFRVMGEDTSRVYFPRLRQIALAAEDLNVLQLLERIERPTCEQTVARMYFEQHDIQFDAVQALCHPSDENRKRVTALFIFSEHTNQRVVGRMGGILWNGTRHEVCDVERIAYDMPRLGAPNATDVVFDLQMMSGTHEPQQDAIERILGCTPRIMAAGSSATHMYVRSGDIRGWTQKTWEELLDCVPCIEGLVVRDDWAFIECGSRGLLAALGETAPPLLVPRLKRLELVMGHEMSPKFAHEWPRELGACVIARKAAAAAAGAEELRSITVSWKGCDAMYLREVLEDGLKTLVGDVEVHCVDGGIREEE